MDPLAYEREIIIIDASLSTVRGKFWCSSRGQFFSGHPRPILQYSKRRVSNSSLSLALKTRSGRRCGFL